MSARATGWWRPVAEDARKIPAFVRRDFLVMWSYRLAFFSDWLNLLVQVVIFYFVGRLIDPSTLPRFGGRPVTYMEFVAVGIALTSFLQVGLGRVVSVMRNEQLMGTLESLLTTPTAPTTIQLGSVIYDLLYIPVRTGVFLLLSSVIFGVSFSFSGLFPALGILLVFIPFVWGIGVVGAAMVLTFRRGSGIVGLGGMALTISSGSYFPIEVFPAWAASIARLNPITIALDGTREALLGDAGWAEALPVMLRLVPAAAVAMGIGIFAFRLALRRERRRGTLGLY